MPGLRRAAGLALLLACLLAPSASGHTVGQRIVGIALHEARMGAVEVPRGSDRGPRLNRYFRAAGSRPGVAWCAAFISYVAGRAGYPVGPGRRGTVSVAALTRWGMRRGLWFAAGWRRPQAGDIALYPSHAGLVVRVSRSGRQWMVDGNWTDAVSHHPLVWQPSGYLRLPDVAHPHRGVPGELVAAG